MHSQPVSCHVTVPACPTSSPGTSPSGCPAGDRGWNEDNRLGDGGSSDEADVPHKSQVDQLLQVSSVEPRIIAPPPTQLCVPLTAQGVLMRDIVAPICNEHLEVRATARLT